MEGFMLKNLKWKREQSVILLLKNSVKFLTATGYLVYIVEPEI